MKLATYNINGVNGRLAQLLDWLEHEAPDVVCLQELKAANARFPAAALQKAGYHAAWQGQPAMHGVAILARKAPLVTRRALPGDEADAECRYLEAAVDGVLIGCLYAPNGNPQPGPRFDYKLAWLERLEKHAAGLLAAGVPVALIGDYNVVPTDLDLYDAQSSWRKDALTQPAAKAAFQRLLAQGWTDALRAKHPDEARLFTFWDYKRMAWPRDAGLRIDHFLLSPPLAKRLRSAGVDRERRGLEGASDHAPAWITLR
ncbi:MAG TPA: exodeoxyribonuclease III [Polyangiales bacterium]|nr:exodeoxyribonuclease III [Polyangiales bacterium]